MSKNYHQLGLEQRYQIEALVKAGFKQKAIALQIGVSPSTICRELRRNTAKRGCTANNYVAINAQRKTCLRHSQKPKQILFTENIKQKVIHHLAVDRWSPELISKCCHGDMVSHERIYQWIWECKHTNLNANKPYKKLYEYLKHGKRRRKRGNRKDSRGIILNRVPIERRPLIVLKRKRLGDFEVDLMMGKNHKGALLVLTDRATLHTRLTKIATKESIEVLNALKSSLKRNKYEPKTLTFDNDKAFSCHSIIAKYTGAKTYFTRPYTSQDKGIVENRIGVIRRFFPKKTNLTFVTNKQVREVERKINNRPIRKFKYKNANQVLQEKIALIT
jgi:transposase, IS30 family